MKRILFFIGVFILFAGCKQEATVVPVLEDLIADYRQDDAIRLEVSEKQITLDPTKRREQALLVTWEPLTDIEAHYPVRYLFKMDVTENDFTTSIPAIEMPEGVFFKTYTHEELEKLIRTHWQRIESGTVSISVRVIAQVSSEEKVIKPLYSTIPIAVTPFQIEASSLFVYGNATGVANMLEMEEIVPGEIYAWRGKFRAGSFKVATVMDQAYPAYGSGDGDQMILMQSEDDPGGSFLIEREANYAILVDRLQRRVSIEEVPYVNLYIGGGATPAGTFTNGTPLPLSWDIYKPHVASITTSLVAGETKVTTTLTNPFSAGTIQLMAKKPNASILTDLDMMQSNNVPDWKWQVLADQAGRYRIVLDTKSMKIQFIKLD